PVLKELWPGDHRFTAGELAGFPRRERVDVGPRAMGVVAVKALRAPIDVVAQPGFGDSVASESAAAKSKKLRFERLKGFRGEITSRGSADHRVRVRDGPVVPDEAFAESPARLREFFFKFRAQVLSRVEISA